MGEESTVARFEGDDWSGELSSIGDNFLLLFRVGVESGTVGWRLIAFLVISCSCRAALLRLLTAGSCRRGVKNLVKRLGVMVGGLLGFMPTSGDDRISYSMTVRSMYNAQVDQNRSREGES